MSTTHNAPTLFPPDTLASQRVMPGSDRARKMTVGSGLKCSALLPSAGPAGLLVKMLLGTSRWASPVCLLTWKPRAMKSGRLYFRLAPSVPRTSEIGSGLLPTPTTDSQNSRSKPYAQGGIPLAYAVKLLPTPTAQDAKNSTLPDSQQERDSLPGALMRLLPTPTAADGERMSETYGAGNQTLLGAARLLPTPVASEAGQGNPNDPKRGKKLTTALMGTPRASRAMASPVLPAPDKKPKGRLEQQVCGPTGGLLNPRFVLQMMGFPSDWCDLTPAEIQQVRDERKQMKKRGGAAPSTPPAMP